MEGTTDMVSGPSWCLTHGHVCLLLVRCTSAIVLQKSECMKRECRPTAVFDVGSFSSDYSSDGEFQGALCPLLQRQPGQFHGVPAHSQSLSSCTACLPTQPAGTQTSHIHLIALILMVL